MSRTAAEPVELAEVAAMREAYRRAMNAQIVHDSHHARGFTRLYRLSLDGAEAGYGAVGDYDTCGRDVIKEFWVSPERRGDAAALFRALAGESGASRVEAQSNDRLLSLMLFEFGRDIRTGGYLFADALDTGLPAGGAVFRPKSAGDRIFPHAVEPEGDRVLEGEGVIVATGGLMTHYNPPFEDVYMEVSPAHRRQGFGSYLVQELKRECRARGKLAAARCAAENTASRRTLERAGLLVCARFLRAALR